MPTQMIEKLQECESTSDEPSQTQSPQAPDPPGRSGQGAESALAHLIEQEKERTGESGCG